jgi:hypothetical protein
MADKPMVRICSWCQQINLKQFARYASNIDPKVLTELAEVDKQVKANQNNFTFTHGVCVPHFIQSYKEIPGMTDDKLKPMIQKLETGGPPPCLITDDATRHAFARGLFTPEMVKQYQQAQQGDNNQITERFQVLAGIRKFHA